MSTKKFQLSSGFTDSFVHFDEVEKKIHVENSQDVQSILDKTQYLQNNKMWDFSGDLTKQAKMRHIAEIDLITLDKLVKRGICTYGGKVLEPAKFKKFLNDSNNKKLRVWSGSV